MSTLEHPRPQGLLHNAAFSQVVAATGTRTIYTAGQVSIDERGALVGAGDLGAQTAQAMRNVGLGNRRTPSVPRKVRDTCACRSPA